jgi:hypothetical protein
MVKSTWGLTPYLIEVLHTLSTEKGTFNGATTFTKTTLSKKGILSITTLSLVRLKTECHKAECCNIAIRLHVVLPSVVAPPEYTHVISNYFWINKFSDCLAPRAVDDTIEDIKMKSTINIC